MLLVLNCWLEVAGAPAPHTSHQVHSNHVVVVDTKPSLGQSITVLTDANNYTQSKGKYNIFKLESGAYNMIGMSAISRMQPTNSTKWWHRTKLSNIVVHSLMHIVYTINVFIFSEHFHISCWKESSPSIQIALCTCSVKKCIVDIYYSL